VGLESRILKEGAAVEDFMKPDRVVIGTEKSAHSGAMRALYEPFTRNRDRSCDGCALLGAHPSTRGDAMLATKISFMNELANIAERCGDRHRESARGIGSDPRIGYSFIYPGARLRGLLFSEGCEALIRSARVRPLARILTRRVGERPPEAAAGAQDQADFGSRSEGRTFALWALPLSYTDDMRRRHPAHHRIAVGRGWERACYDPVPH